MAGISDLFDASGDDFVLRVHVQPGAGRSAVVGRHGDALKIRVAAPPVGGRANDATRELLARELEIAPSALELTGGASSRLKRFRVSGVERKDLERWLGAKTTTPTQPTQLELG